MANNSDGAAVLPSVRRLRVFDSRESILISALRRIV
jgi:hypothetical protein